VAQPQEKKMADTMAPPAKGKVKAKTAKTETGEKKARAPRVDYGYKPGAKITVNKDKEQKFRGQTQEWFERLLKSDGKAVEHFISNNEGITNQKGNPERPRGWLAHFCKSGYASLSGGEEPAAKDAA
jgi:hypothetical protein